MSGHSHSSDLQIHFIPLYMRYWRKCYMPTLLVPEISALKSMSRFRYLWSYCLSLLLIHDDLRPYIPTIIYFIALCLSMQKNLNTACFIPHVFSTMPIFSSSAHIGTTNECCPTIDLLWFQCFPHFMPFWLKFTTGGGLLQSLTLLPIRLRKQSASMKINNGEPLTAIISPSILCLRRSSVAITVRLMLMLICNRLVNSTVHPLHLF